MKMKFYERCAELLGVPHEHNTFNDNIYRHDRNGVLCMTNAGRFAGRMPGNGRFQGYGLIRLYGSKVHVCLTKPISINKLFDSEEECLVFLQSIIN